MDQPGKVEAEFLAIIVLDEIERLHVLRVAFVDESPCKSPAVLEPRGVNMLSFWHMHREVRFDDTTLDQVIYIHIRSECFSDDGLMLACIKLIEVVGGEALEWLLAVIL